MIPRMLPIELSSRTSQKHFKTLDFCDSCFKERINLHIKVEKKSLTNVLTYGENAEKIRLKHLMRAPTKNFEEMTR